MFLLKNHQKHRTGLSVLSAFMLLTLTGIQVQAQSWTDYKDEDGIFYVLMPDNYKVNKKVFRMNDKEVYTSTESTATIDNTDFIDVVKKFAIRYDQTFARTIANNDIPDLLDKDLGKYIKYYESIGGVVRDKELGSFNSRPGGEVIMAYRTEDGKLASTRIRIVYSDTTRLEQIYTGPEESMFDHRAKDFFNSLTLKDGRTAYEDDITRFWSDVVSPFELFKISVPNAAPPYVPEDIKISKNDKVERLSLQLFDPVYDNTLFYNVYGYRFGTLMTMENVQQVIMEKHLKKFRIDIRKLKFSHASNGAYPVLGTKMHFSPPDAYPYMNTIKLNAYYYGPFVVVQEMVGNNIHIESDVATRIMKYLQFTPVEAHKNQQSEKASERMETLKQETPTE